MTDTWTRGAIFHPDPDHLVALRLSASGFDSIGQIQEYYLDGELSLLEFEAVLEGWFENQ